MRTQVHFIQNVLAFGLKRKDVLLKRLSQINFETAFFVFAKKSGKS